MDVYRSVLKAWQSAISTMEKLILDMPQRVQNGAILLGLSAWHLYPDVVVLGKRTTGVDLKDPLIATGGTLTLILHDSSGEDLEQDGVYWSLSLAHLRYYGDPIASTRSTSLGSSQISFKEYEVLLLGDTLKLMGCIDPSSVENDLFDWAEALNEFGKFLQEGSKFQESSSHLKASSIKTWLKGPRGPFALLVRAAASLVTSDGLERLGEPHNAVDFKGTLALARCNLRMKLDLLENLLHFMQSTALIIGPLSFVSSVAEVYLHLPGATVSMDITSFGIPNPHWYTQLLHIPPPYEYLSADDVIRHEPSLDNYIGQPLGRAQAFACVAMFESGNLNLSPKGLKDVIARSSGNSLFVAASLLCDPSEAAEQDSIKRIIGNVGRANIAMLYAAASPRIKRPNPNSWNAINHNEYDGNAADFFSGTSMHLSFTGFETPIDSTGFLGAKDSEVHLLESVLSVHDRGIWIADLNILAMLRSPKLHVLRFQKDCGHSEKHLLWFSLKCLDSRAEFLDRPGELAL
ncbi:MAG: hypothetical protein M1835_000705 [Candelina submexicana]|nr:MAG: hypothetical protein M1835_000705 [Candelina submexicana]